jgi:PAS domain S-box-containing protein
MRVSAQPVVYLGVAMLAMVYGTVTLLVINDRIEAELNARRQGENIVRIIEQSYSHIFQSVDSSLLFLRRAYQSIPSDFNMASWASDLSPTNELASNFVFVDANGRVILATSRASTTTSNIIGADFSDREYFQRQKDSPFDDLVFSPPLTLKVSGGVAIILSRRITAPDGTFAGIVAALVNPVELGKTAAGINLGPLGTFGLLGLDGIVRIRAVEGKADLNVSGQKIGPADGVLTHVVRARSGNFWNKPGLFDDASRLVSYRALNSFPMIAVVSVTKAEVYRRANEVAAVYVGIALLLTIVILIAVRWGMARERNLGIAIAEMKQAQNAARQGEERYRLVEEAVNDGIWDWNVVTDVDYRSSRWKSILGYADDEIRADAAFTRSLIHPDDKAAVAAAIAAHLQEGKPFSLEFRLRHKNGGYRWVHSRGKAMRDASNRPVRMLGSMTDITERKNSETLVQESHDNLARAEALAHLGHTKFEKTSGQYTWSDGTYRIMRKSPDTYTPTPEDMLRLVHPDDRAAHEKHHSDVMAGVEVPRRTVRMILEDGQIIHVEFWSVPIRDKNGVITGKFSTLQDVTTLKRNEALVSESHANLERAERLALLGHYKIDRMSDQLVWSEGIFRIFGLSPLTFKPTLGNAIELVHPDDRPLLRKFRDDAMAGHEVPHMTMRAFRADGQLIDIEYWSTPVRDDDGAVTGIFGTLQDVTVRKRAEEALARVNQELEARVSERTAELAREMRRREEAQMTLSQMQKMEAVGQLTAGIAHDFNNLLAVIGGSLEFVDGAAARGLTAEPELIDAALRATRRGRELVRRLLAFSRQSPLRAEATTIDQLVLDTLRLLQRTLGQGIDMVTQLDAEAAVISVDRNQMANALLNLALNARDAMPEGGQLTIATKCRQVSADAAGHLSRWPTGQEVCITISDTGAGMTDDVRSRAFEPFFTTKPDGLGSGLGLSMVQGFVEQSGGKIDIESSPGNGTTITIRLPRIETESCIDEADAITGLTSSGREKTVLLVEDDPDVRVVTAAQLKQLGYKVHAVANGLEAIDLIASPANIDITLTDIVLPGGLDGVALLKEAMRARPRMGVLCMSGYDPTQKHRKWLKIQNINFLEKPFSSVRLAQALDAALAH